MKKFFSLILIGCLALFGGIVLTACDSAFSVVVSVPEEEQKLFDVVLKKDNVVFEDEKIPTKSSLKVEIVSKFFDVDFSDLEISVNGKSKNLILNQTYGKDDNHLFGYFAVTNITSNTKIEIGGAKINQTTFVFESNNFEADSEKLALMEVSFDGENFENLKESIETRKTFNKVTNQTKFFLKVAGVTSLNFGTNQIFKLQQSADNVKNLTQTLKNTIYEVDMGANLTSSSYQLIVDLSNVSYTQFGFIKPAENLTYSIDVEKTIVKYNDSQQITVNKLARANWTNIKLMCNTTELVLVSSDDTKAVFLFPEHSTPNMMGGETVYYLTVKGIVTNPTRKLSYISEEEGVQNQVINAKFKHIDENGDYQAPSFVNENNIPCGYQAEKVAMTWKFEYNDAYVSKYDLANYEIWFNDEEEPICNVLQCLTDQTTSFKKDLGNGYSLRATYNSQTSTFDEFALEFVVGEEDCVFYFKEFAPYRKEIGIIYKFEDSRIDGVEYKIVTSDSNGEWQTLSRNVSVNKIVVGGDIVKFRFKVANGNIGSHEFVIEDETLATKTGDMTTYTSGDVTYTEIGFKISDLQFVGQKTFKLVPSINV